MDGIKFGVVVPQNDFKSALAAAREADDLGYYSVSINDHFFSQVGSPRGPQLEAMTTLAALAAHTERVRLVPSVLSAGFRNPALLAKMVTTLDHVSDGRFTLGIGAGWLESEYKAHGYEFGSARRRIVQLEETLKILRAMWTEDFPTFQGELLQVESASSEPRPVQGSVPIMIGGSGDRLLSVAARYADIVNLIPPTSAGRDFLKSSAAATSFTDETLRARIDRLNQLLNDVGRDPGSVEIGGLSMLHVVEDESDESQGRLIKRLGFAGFEEACTAPVALIGTPQIIAEEIERRITENNISYFILVPTSLHSVRLFASEVMPRFANRKLPDRYARA